MFLLVSVRHVGAHPGGHQHGISIQISINLGKTFLRISRIRNILLTWILARNLVYLPPFISQIPDFIYSTVLIFILIYFEWRDTENQQLQHSPWKERWSEKSNESSKKCSRRETSRLSTPIPFLPRQYGRGISKRTKRPTVEVIYWCSKYSFNSIVREIYKWKCGLPSYGYQYLLFLKPYQFNLCKVALSSGVKGFSLRGPCPKFK